MRSLIAAVVVLASSSVLADDKCEIQVGPNDVFKKSGDLTIEAGQTVEDAFALDGKVIVKKGAKVKSAISFHGDVVVEDGAKVTKTALAIGGAVKAAKGADVNSSIELSDKGVRIRGEDGGDVDVNLSVNGKSLGERIAEEALAKTKNCRVVAKK